MDYVEEGRRIAVPKDGLLVLSYLESCTYEAIFGGTVTIGAKQSTVKGGEVTRKTEPCDGGRFLLSDDASKTGGVTVFRDVLREPRAQLTLFNTRPVLILRKPGQVTFERLDAEAEPIIVSVTGKSLDLLSGGVQLASGALYQVKSGTRHLIVKVAPDAKADTAPALGRMIRF